MRFVSVSASPDYGAWQWNKLTIHEQFQPFVWFQLTSQIWNNCWGIISFCLNYNAIKVAWSLRYQSDLSVGICTIISSLFLFFSPSPPRKLFPEACRVELTQEMMQKADVDPALRPAELTIPQIRALADAYAHLCTREPSLLSFEFREELRLNHLGRQSNTPMVTFMDTPPDTPPSPQQACWKIKSTETRRSPLIGSVSTERQQSALSFDISTWRMHEFLKCFFPLLPERNR